MTSPEQVEATGHGEPMEIDPEPKTEIITAEELGRIRAHWWECNSLDDLNMLAQLSPVTNEIINFQYNLRPAEEDFRMLLKTEATVYVSRTQDNCANAGLGGFQKLVLPSSEEDAGVVIAIYLSLLNIFGNLTRSHPKTCQRVFMHLSPNLAPKDDNGPDQKIAKIAFDQKPAKRDTTSSLYKRILGFYRAYQETALYFSPFTSVIGPSGIRKSFLTKQLAHQNYVYVIYACLAGNDVHPYPTRSPIASLFGRPYPRDQTTTLLECFVATSLTHVKLCRSFGINAMGFYEMQVHEAFESLQNIFVDCLEEFFDRVMSELRAAGKARRVRSNDVEPDEDYDYSEYVDKSLLWYENLLYPVFKELRRELGKSDAFKCFLSKEVIELGTDPKEPAAVICFDEARSLFSPEPKEGPMRYLALRALRNRWHSAEQPEFFSLLLDTSSRVTELSPPRHRDPSCKYPHDNEMFPPIFQINTMDLFVEDSQPYDPNDLLSTDAKKVDLALRHLYGFGRPLWGAFLKAAGISAAGFQKLVQKKLFPRETPDKNEIEPTDAIALISYRVNFYVALYSLAETLTSDNLRYVVGINAERTLLQTLQFSEPILAFSAGQQLLMHPHVRLAAIEALYDNVSKGFVHLGDVGEDVASLILLFTFDRVHGSGAPRPIKFSNFIAMLLPPMVIGSPNDKTLVEAYGRSAGLLLPQGFKGADMVIPIRTKKMMTFLVIQVKNRRDSVMGSFLKEDARTSLQSGVSIFTPRPHFGLYMSLRSHNQGFAAEVVSPELCPPKVTRFLKNFSRTYLWENANRVVMAAVGLDVALYPGIAFSDSGTGASETKDIMNYLKSLLNQTTEVPQPDDREYFESLTPLR